MCQSVRRKLGHTNSLALPKRRELFLPSSKKEGKRVKISDESAFDLLFIGPGKKE